MSGDSSDALAPFPSTNWPLVEQAGANGQSALNQLLIRYLPALRAHLVWDRKLRADHVDDLLQEFMSQKIVEQNFISRADARRGKFRTFLLISLNRFVTSQLRKQAARRGSPANPISADLDAVSTGGPEPTKEFESAWAREVIAETLRRMRAECEHAGREHVWAVFETRVLQPVVDQKKPPPYADLLIDLDLESPRQASNVLITAKRMFVRHLRLVVSEYVRDKGEVDEEIEQFKAILGQ